MPTHPEPVAVEAPSMPTVMEAMAMGGTGMGEDMAERRGRRT